MHRLHKNIWKYVEAIKLKVARDKALKEYKDKQKRERASNPVISE